MASTIPITVTPRLTSQHHPVRNGHYPANRSSSNWSKSNLVLARLRPPTPEAVTSGRDTDPVDDDVRRRSAAGQSLRRIKHDTSLARGAVRKSAFAECLPRHGRRGPEHAVYGEGSENAMQLWSELSGLGFPVTVKQIRRWLAERHTGQARTTVRRLQQSSVGAPTAPTSSPRRSLHRSGCRGISLASRRISMLTPPMRWRVCCSMARRLRPSICAA